MASQAHGNHGYCIICRSKTTRSSIFCPKHYEAQKPLVSSYPLWQKAYGQLSWENYLKELRESPKIGEWVLQVLDYFQSTNQPPIESLL